VHEALWHAAQEVGIMRPPLHWVVERDGGGQSTTADVTAPASRRQWRWIEG